MEIVYQKVIDSYNNYNSTKVEKLKRKFYEKHWLSISDCFKTKALQKKISDYVFSVYNTITSSIINAQELERIKYRSDIGYFLVSNHDCEETQIIYYGKSELEAFYNAIVDLETKNSHDKYFCLDNRLEYEKEYSHSFLDGSDDIGYHAAFFFADFSLKSIQKYFNGEIPDVIIKYYEQYVNSNLEEQFLYNFETKKLEKVEEKIKRLR